MGYALSSLKTFSYWRYALFSWNAVGRILAATGSLYLFLEILDFFQIYTRDKYHAYSLIVIIAAATIYVVFTRRPVSMVRYKVPKKDFAFEVRIGDLLGTPGNVVISTSTTFDTDMSRGLISPESLQGQFALKFFQGNTAEIDRQIEESLSGVDPRDEPNAPGKRNRYPVGTVATVKTHGQSFYFTAMSDLNKHGTAQSSVHMVEQALEGLWRYVGERGELGDLVMPLMGTGRGRIELPRKKMIERIAQSFADASREKVFANKLTIVITPGDAEKYGINLFEVRDYLSLSLHI